MIVSDLELARKLERTEGRANADFVETRARLEPSSGAGWTEVGGAYAMYDGPGSPLTQSFGLGIFEETTDGHLDRLEAFFNERGAPVFHEVSPMAPPSLLSMLGGRGYRPVELTSVMCRPLGHEIGSSRARNPKLITRVIRPDEVELWAKTSADGWASEDEGLADFMLKFGRISAQCAGSYPYVAELDGGPIATGMLFIFGDNCLLAGASTVPGGRGLGAQTALLEDRLRFAAGKGCKLAMMGAAPGSQSQKNAQRNGFDIAYTRIKWHLTE